MVLISAFLLPLWFLIRKAGGDGFFPQLEYGSILGDLMSGKTSAGQLGEAATEALRKDFLPWGHGDFYHFLALFFTLMVGTTGLPHIMIRFYTVKNEDTARKSVLWGLFFIGLLYWSSPVYAVLGKFWNPNCSDRQALMVGRIVTALLCLIVIFFALNPIALIALIVDMAFALAGNTIFPAVVLGIWYSKSNKYGAFVGMCFGLIMTLLAMFGWSANIPTFHGGGLLPATSSSLIICPLAFLINIIVSNVMHESLDEEPMDRSDALLRKIHSLPERE